MNFQKLIKKNTLLLVLALRFSNLGKSQNFFDSLTFFEWRNVCRRRWIASEDVRSLALSEMAGLAGENLSRWWSIYWAAPAENALKGFALIKIQETAKNLSDYLSIYRHLNNTEARQFALQQMKKTSWSVAVWFKAYCDHPYNDEIRNLAFQKLLASTDTFEEWSKVHEGCADDTDLKTVALYKMTESATTFDQWRHVFFVSSSYQHEALAYQRMCGLVER